MKAISLFASGGIGDLALKANDIDIIVANELLDDRCKVLEFNYPETRVIQGDIRLKKNEIILQAENILQNEVLDILYATPPCQGMSKNGRGTILNNIRKGLRPNLDERNRLIIPVIEIAKELKPRIIILENVPEMQDTIIETTNGDYKTILDFIKDELGSEYVGHAEVVEFADYGVPQKRQRLISVFTRENNIIDFYKITKTLLPSRTHKNIEKSNGIAKWVTLKDVIADLPKLDAKNKELATSNIDFHNVPLLDDEKYFWVSNTKLEKSAFDNQCIECGSQENNIHGSSQNNEGINRSNTSTPIRCIKCNSLLPRPWVKENGEYRLMKGFTSAYKRMKWNSPANALTTNLSYACSDSKIHPDQNRVLSLYEAFIVHTISDFDYQWKRNDNRKVSNKTIREIIGESIPPRGLKIIVEHLCKLLNKVPIENIIFENNFEKQYVLFEPTNTVYNKSDLL
jgi:DNA (cytosine-5)-methyltransferase 1